MTIDDCFVVHNLKVLEGKDGLFVGMPRRPNNEKDLCHPLNTETRQEINKLVIAKYEEEKNKAEA